MKDERNYTEQELEEMTNAMLESNLASEPELPEKPRKKRMSAKKIRLFHLSYYRNFCPPTLIRRRRVAGQLRGFDVAPGGARRIRVSVTQNRVGASVSVANARIAVGVV